MANISQEPLHYGIYAFRKHLSHKGGGFYVCYLFYFPRAQEVGFRAMFE